MWTKGGQWPWALRWEGRGFYVETDHNIVFVSRLQSGGRGCQVENMWAKLRARKMSLFTLMVSGGPSGCWGGESYSIIDNAP